MNSKLMNTYAPLPVAFVRGEGAWLWDEDGNRYLDAISGLGVCALGHAHPKVAEVIADQAGRLIHTGNLVQIPWQEKLAELVADVSGLDRVFFGNSGAEAIECAFKISRVAGHQRGFANPGVIVMEHGFHGRTMAALSATASRKVRAGFEPLVSGFVRAPFGDTGVIRKIATSANEITAVLVEPIQGEAGIRVPPPGYLCELREICDENGWLLMFDEIQSGLCRTGEWYAHQHENVKPDVLTTAKALGNGLPIGACAARGAAAEVLTPGRHGSTFGGNPLVSRTACAVLDIMREENLCGRAAASGDMLLNAFRRRLGADERVQDIRGKGLMIGIELNADANHLRQRALEQRVLLNVTQDRVIRLLPPLIIDEDQAGQIVDVVCSLIENSL
ncbi:MAG: aspartate aminotransferase family protein [Xanthomonadales bacterium]|nr:aspartate aminotransferase family protein [Gammaproteobacteria bacterium]MBT8053303.1 aspartate aminotransferase family protein [Gammaproteobacteria bacterium]NND58015.1 aspartate aminotransferase family protein [Xanthomonadales bacterium]NNK52112.1 aspartate aminotransferase family protein [Xanthomonadales bacterium]